VGRAYATAIDDADARLEYSRRRDAAGAAVRAGKLAAARRAEYEVENRIHGKQVVVFDRPAGGAYDDPHRRAVEGAVLALVRERHPSDGEPTPIYRPAERHGQATEFVGGRPGSGGGVRSRGFVVGAGDGVTVGTADGRRLIGVRPSDPPDCVRFKIHVGLGLKPPPALTERWAPVLREERAAHKSASGVSFARESRPASPRVAAAVRRFWGRATASFARDAGPGLSGLEDDLLGLSRPELLDVLAEAAEESWEGDDASFSFRDQPRVPAGSPGGGRWAGGVSPGTAAARDAASDAVREFARGRGPHTAAEAEALAGHLAKLTVAQIHTLKKEHGLKGSAPNKAALVAKLAERFRAHRERNPVAAKEPVPDWPEGYDIFEKRDVFADEPVDPRTLEPGAATSSPERIRAAHAQQIRERDEQAARNREAFEREYAARGERLGKPVQTVNGYPIHKDSKTGEYVLIDPPTGGEIWRGGQLGRARAIAKDGEPAGRPPPPAPPPPPAAPEPAGLHEVRPGGRPFKPGGVHVETAAGGEDAVRRVFGRNADPSLLPGMANAAPGWNVLVTPDPVTGGVAVSSFGPDGKASRSFYRRADGKLVAHNESFHIPDELPDTGRPNPLKGQGLRLFTAQVNALREAGVDLIRTHAAGEPGGDQNGYYTWPRFGFSGTMEDDAFDELPSALRERLGDSREVRDLFDLPGGAEAWKEVGSSVYNAKFDLTPGSRNMKALEDYTREREARGK
jgi:hypothetical protein